MNTLEGKVALVTGASAPRGIGRATAVKLASLGATVVLTDVDASLTVDDQELHRVALLNRAVDEIKATNGAAIGLAMDVTDFGQIESVTGQIKDRYGRLDILVNNAATLAGVGPFLDASADDWKTSFAVNIAGAVELCKIAIPLMQAQGSGRIINISSISGMGGVAGRATYSTMKHGLIGLTRSIAAEFGPAGILCNAICPGYISTDMHMAANERLAVAKSLSVDAVKAIRYGEVALGDAGRPEDIAETVAFLAGPGGNYITGVVVPVTGGVPYGI